MDLKILICGLLTITLSTSAGIPNTVKKCNRKDKNFSECLRAAVEDALSKTPMKAIGLQSLEPLEVPSLVIGAGTGAVAFQQNYKNVKISGFSEAKCNKAEMNFETKTFTADCTTPLARLIFDYEINGKILLLPIFGKGPGIMDLEQLNLQCTFSFEEYEKKGQNYYKIKNTGLVLTPKRIKFKLENLFDGDKALGDNINQVLNDNWSEVFADVKKSYEDAFSQIFQNIFNQVLKKISVEEMFGHV